MDHPATHLTIGQPQHDRNRLSARSQSHNCRNALERLEELANNLWYSWDRRRRRACSPACRIPVEGDQSTTPRPSSSGPTRNGWKPPPKNPVFPAPSTASCRPYDTYHEMPADGPGARPAFADDDPIACFCAEFGFRESLPIYSGGLGILAGDHCKAASDMGLPFIGVGLLYRQGYFQQNADRRRPAAGDLQRFRLRRPAGRSGARRQRQRPCSSRSNCRTAPCMPRSGKSRLAMSGSSCSTPGCRRTAHDREITHRLYGGDKTTRIEQEILLGVGGPPRLGLLGLKPTVWHVNEGHAAFLILERIRSLVKGGLPYHAAALEAVAANVVFTTHTPVPAGHDHFSEEMIRHYFGRLVPRSRPGLRTPDGARRRAGQDRIST